MRHRQIQTLIIRYRETGGNTEIVIETERDRERQKGEKQLQKDRVIIKTKDKKT